MLAHHPDFQGAYKLRSAERVEHLFQIIKMSARRVTVAEQSHIGFGMPDTLAAVGLQQPSHVAPLSAGMAAGVMGPANLAPFSTQPLFGAPPQMVRDQFNYDPAMAAYAGFSPMFVQPPMTGHRLGNPLLGNPLGGGGGGGGWLGFGQPSYASRIMW